MVDLILLPFTHDSKSFQYSHSVLELVPHCQNLFKEIDAFQKSISTPNSIKMMGVAYDAHKDPRRVAGSFSSYLCGKLVTEYQKTQYGKTPVDHLGLPVRWLYAKELLQWKNHAEVQKNLQMQATWAYLEHLDAHTKVALFWR